MRPKPTKNPFGENRYDSKDIETISDSNVFLSTNVETAILTNPATITLGEIARMGHRISMIVQGTNEITLSCHANNTIRTRIDDETSIVCDAPFTLVLVSIDNIWHIEDSTNFIVDIQQPLYDTNVPIGSNWVGNVYFPRKAKILSNVVGLDSDGAIGTDFTVSFIVRNLAGAQTANDFLYTSSSFFKHSFTIAGNTTNPVQYGVADVNLVVDGDQVAMAYLYNGNKGASTTTGWGSGHEVYMVVHYIRYK